MPRRFESKRLFNIWGIFGLALLIRWCAVYLYYFVYKTPGGLPPDPTATEVYELLARELIEGRGLQSWLFAYRPPLEPMFIALTYIVTGARSPVAAVFAQTFVSASICLLAHQIAKELGADDMSRKAAALLAAIDPASIGIGLILMAETLSNLFIALSLVFLARLLKTGRLRDATACAAAIVLAALARPNAIYFAVAVAALIIAFMPRRPVVAGIFLGAFVLGVTPWYFRNYAYHNLFTFSTTGNFNLLFYKAVSVEHRATGKPVLQVQAEFAYELERRLGIAQPPETYDHQSMWRQLVPADPRADRLMGDMAVEVYLAHPVTYLLVMPLSLVKLLAFTDEFAPLGALRWLEVIFNSLLYGFAALGAFVLWRRRLWVWPAVTVLPSIYFVAIPLITGGIQDTRARTSFTVCLAILAAEGIRALREQRRGRA
jgi:hypothetical protein